MNSAITILYATSLSATQLREIQREVEKSFRCSVSMQKDALDIEKTFDTSRGQYYSTALLAQLVKRATSISKFIALVDVDLFIPVLTFVFGEAQFDGNAAVVSTHRLVNQFYGLPENEQLLLHRITKEIIHELGHTFGLYHCRNFECVMRSSTYVEDIDLKKSSFCGECWRKLDIVSSSS